MPLNQAIVGGVVCFRYADGLPDTSRVQTVTQADIDDINNLIRKNATVYVCWLEIRGCFVSVTAKIAGHLKPDLKH